VGRFKRGGLRNVGHAQGPENAKKKKKKRSKKKKTAPGNEGLGGSQFNARGNNAFPLSGRGVGWGRQKKCRAGAGLKETVKVRRLPREKKKKKGFTASRGVLENVEKKRGKQKKGG